MKHLLILALVLAGCGIVDPCDTQVRNLRIGDDRTPDANAATLSEVFQLRSDGWKCEEFPTRDAAGKEISVSYGCTRCK